MSLAPLLQASPDIQLHAFAAMGAFVIGAVQLAAPKGTLPHRIVGSIWVPGAPVILQNILHDILEFIDIGAWRIQDHVRGFGIGQNSTERLVYFRRKCDGSCSHWMDVSESDGTTTCHTMTY
jgi:hypothetical protein